MWINDFKVEYLGFTSCIHDKTWPEGSSWERFGGLACEPCSKHALRKLGYSNKDFAL